MRYSSILFTLLFLAVATIFTSCSDDNEETTITVTTSDVSLSIDENPDSGQSIGTVSATTNNGSLTFSITQQTPAGAFAINAQTGELTVANPALFNFETAPEITGQVKVANGDVSQNANITITVLDVVENTIYEGDVLLRTQDEVNTFGENNYTQINGSLTLGDPGQIGSSDITDLSPLASIGILNGSIVIYRNPILATTQGLNIIEMSNNGEIFIAESPSLVTVKGLLGATSIDQLTIEDNNSLSDLSGINQISAVESDLIINNCPVLPNLDWLNKLITVSGGSLLISGCDSILNLEGLNNLITADLISIIISENNLLENLNGLSNLNTNVENLRVLNNSALKNINGLHNINASITLTIGSNSSLENLHGLEKITTLSELILIGYNDSLINLEGLNNLVSVNSYVSILQNGNLKSLDGLNNLSMANNLQVVNNAVINDFCALQNLYSQNQNNAYSAFSNLFNPTKQDIIDGNCSL